MHLCADMAAAISPTHLAPPAAWRDLALGGRGLGGLKGRERRGVWGQSRGTQQVSGQRGAAIEARAR